MTWEGYEQSRVEVKTISTHNGCNIFFHIEFCLSCLPLSAGEGCFWLARQTASIVVSFKTVAKLEPELFFAASGLCRSDVQEALKGDRCARGDYSDLDC